MKNSVSIPYTSESLTSMRIGGGEKNKNCYRIFSFIRRRRGRKFSKRLCSNDK